jgi:hypothetical protein
MGEMGKTLHRAITKLACAHCKCLRFGVNIYQNVNRAHHKPYELLSLVFFLTWRLYFSI